MGGVSSFSIVYFIFSLYKRGMSTLNTGIGRGWVDQEGKVEGSGLHVFGEREEKTECL